jgi:hypothetical protein
MPTTLYHQRVGVKSNCCREPLTGALDRRIGTATEGARQHDVPSKTINSPATGRPYQGLGVRPSS